MTALLELKQRIKNLYSQYEIYILPVLRFVLAMVYFIWINTNMGYMKQIDNIFIVLILALICSILPSGVMIFVGFALMVAHGYALGIEVAGFMLVLILFMAILFLRFSSDNNLVLVFTPLSFGFSVPTLLPIGSGLLCNAFSALPAGCGVIIYYFIRFIRVQHKLLENPDVAIADKLKLLTDGIVQNWGMWITVIAFIAVILLVNLIRTRSFDYAWRIAIIAGGVVYVLMILAGGFYFGLNIDVVTLIIYTVISVVIGLLLEFFVFGGDYTRTERLEYEDDEYSFKIGGIYDYTGSICVFMPQKELNQIFDLGDDYFSGYFSNTEITDIDSTYIGSVIDLDALTKISRQLNVSMGSMMGMVNVFAIAIYMILIYLLSKIIIEKNAQSISMTKILGYTNGEISRLYILSTSLVVILCLLISLPIETTVMEVLFREMMLSSISGWITLWIDPMIYVKMFVAGVVTYGLVAMLEYRRIRRVPMSEALKNAE